jgi:maltooligosyltrehalose trehalohydrolase
MGDGARLRLTANLSDRAIAHRQGEPTGTAIWGSEAGDPTPPWSVFWHLDAR